MKSAPPPFWCLMMRELFETDDGFAVRLWQVFPKSQGLVFQLLLCAERSGPVGDRVRHLAQDMLPPLWLINASLRLSPEQTGKPRLKECTKFEERVLELVGHDGRWKW
jgi:hypothetical protein